MDDLLQSEGWERFQRALGRKTERVDGVLAIEVPMPFGMTYLYSPRTTFPFRHCEEPERRRGNLTSTAQTLAERAGVIFWRAESGGQVSGVRCQVSEPRVMRRLVEPEWTWRTSLEGSDDERLAAMHEKHRYNVRLAQRHGVAVRVAASAKLQAASAPDVEMFWSLLQETARRQGIQTHPRSYYETMLTTLPDTKVYLAEHSAVPLAAAMVAYHGDTATYLHGGSSYEHRSLMAPHLLHWQAMREAKAAGMRWYDWGGIESGVVSRESGGARCDPHASAWSGMTRFKQGFGGEAVHHPATMDLVFRPNWYRLLSWLARVRG